MFLLCSYGFDHNKSIFWVTLYSCCLKGNMLSTEKIWYHESSKDLFAAAMSVNRFSFLSTFLTFDDKISWDEHWKYEKFACIREFFEKENKNNGCMQYPSSYLAIDETLYPYCGTNGIKQYNPSKPGKYWLLCKGL